MADPRDREIERAIAAELEAALRRADPDVILADRALAAILVERPFLSAAVLDCELGSRERRTVVRRLRERDLPFLFYGTDPPDTVTSDGAPFISTTASPEDAVRRSPSDQRTEAKPMKLKGASILVVEDDPFIALDLKDTLLRAGAVVVGPAHNLAQALRLAEKDHLRAAVLDFRLEVGNTLPVAARLTELGIPFLFQTSDPRAVLSALPDALVLSKPVD